MARKLVLSPQWPQKLQLRAVGSALSTELYIAFSALLEDAKTLMGLTGEDEAMTSIAADTGSNFNAELLETIDDRSASQAVLPGAGLNLAITEAAEATFESSMPDDVQHGWNAAAARPSTTGRVTWIGWVRPDNMAPQDNWQMVQNPTQRLTSEIPWAALYLANDQAAHYADGDNMATIYDSSGHGYNLTRNTDISSGFPVFESSSASFSGKPSMIFNASAMKSGAVASTPQPYSVFAIIRATNIPASILARGTFNLLYRRNTTQGSWTFNAGGTQVSVDGADTNTPNSRPQYLDTIYNSPNSAFYKGGILKVSAQNIGAASLSTGPLLIGGLDATNLLTGEIAALGICPSAFTSDQLGVLDDFADSEYALA